MVSSSDSMPRESYMRPVWRSYRAVLTALKGIFLRANFRVAIDRPRDSNRSPRFWCCGRRR